MGFDYFKINSLTLIEIEDYLRGAKVVSKEREYIIKSKTRR